MNAQKYNESTTIAVIAEYDPGFPPHPATNAAIEHSSKQRVSAVNLRWERHVGVSSGKRNEMRLREWSAAGPRRCLN
jgi:hypothetical protein